MAPRTGTRTTAERGYGTPHRQERELRLTHYRPGDSCAHGGEQMWWWPLEVARQYLDLPHNADRTGYLPGLACRKHNRADGAINGNQARPAGGLRRPQPGLPTCRTCGSRDRHAGRQCEICGAHYHPNHMAQRTCSRRCGVELKRRSKPPKPKPARKPPRERATWPSSRLQHYTCRYCGAPGVTTARGQPREVCTARPCQLARLMANNLRVRQGLTAQQADAQVSNTVVRPGVIAADIGWSRTVAAVRSATQRATAAAASRDW